MVGVTSDLTNHTLVEDVKRSLGQQATDKRLLDFIVAVINIYIYTVSRDTLKVRLKYNEDLA